MEPPDIVSLGKQSDLAIEPRPPPSTRVLVRGKYGLLERLDRCRGDDECYRARLGNLASFEHYIFLRRFPASRLDWSTIDAFKRIAMVNMPGVAQIFELGSEEGWGFVAGELVEGASIAELLQANARVPWLVALAVVFDACERLARLYERHGDVDLALTPARVRLSMANGNVTLCAGLPATTRAPWHRVLCALIYPILALAAADDERALLRALFSDEHPDAVWVASDALVQRHPELDPVLPMVFLALAGRLPREVAREALIARVSVEELAALWQVVVDAASPRC